MDGHPGRPTHTGLRDSSTAEHQHATLIPSYFQTRWRLGSIDQHHQQIHGSWVITEHLPVLYMAGVENLAAASLAGIRDLLSPHHGTFVLGQEMHGAHAALLDKLGF